MRAHAKTILAGLACAALLAGCTEGGTPTPTGTTPGGQTTGAPAGNPNLPHSGAPKVSDPIADTAKWEADPCGVVSEAQLASIGIKLRETPEPELDKSTGISCQWKTEGGFGSSFSGSLTTFNPEGMSSIYAKNEKDGLGVFEPLHPIEGHPAVRADQHDQSDSGHCGIAVGLRDDLTYDVDVSFDRESKEAKDPCGYAVKIATLAVKTMKGAA